MADKESFERGLQVLTGYIERQAPDPAEARRIIEAIYDARGFVPPAPPLITHAEINAESWHKHTVPAGRPDFVLCVVNTAHEAYKEYRNKTATFYSLAGDPITYLMANKLFANYWLNKGFITHWMEIPELGDK